MIRREFVQRTGLAAGSLFLASLLKGSDVFGMPNEDNHLQIATDPAFTDIVVDAIGFAFPEHAPGGLVPDQLYYWRQIRVVGSGQVLVYHGRLLGEQFQELIDLYNNELIPFIQEVNEEPVPPIPETLAICHIPPGNPARARTIVVPVEDLDDHLAHGDHQGECADDASSGKSGDANGESGKDGANIPDEYELGRNYPNPFAALTTIPFALPRASRVRLSVFNTLGQQVSVIVDTELAAGRHSILWSASGLTSGSYLVVMEAGAFKETRRITVNK